MENEEKFSIALYTQKKYPSSQAYNGVKNESIFVCYFFDCKVSS